MAYWLRRCATSRTVPGSIPGGVTGFFSDIFLPTVPLPRNISEGKGGRCVRLTTSPHSFVECHEILEPKPPGGAWGSVVVKALRY